MLQPWLAVSTISNQADNKETRNKPIKLNSRTSNVFPDYHQNTQSFHTMINNGTRAHLISSSRGFLLGVPHLRGILRTDWNRMSDFWERNFGWEGDGSSGLLALPLRSLKREWLLLPPVSQSLFFSIFLYIYILFIFRNYII